MHDMSSVTLGNLLTVAEAAKRLRISDVLVLRYIQQGRLRAEKKGRAWLIDEASVEEFEQTPRSPGNPEFGPDFWKKKRKSC